MFYIKQDDHIDGKKGKERGKKKKNMSKIARVSQESIFINNTEYPQIPPKPINKCPAMENREI